MHVLNGQNEQTDKYSPQDLVSPNASRAGGQNESIDVEPPSRADKLVEAIGRALHDGEIGAVEMLLRLLALEDPRRAQDVVDTMRLGIAITEAAS